MFSGVDSSFSGGGVCGQMVFWGSGLGPQRGCPNLIQTDPQPVAQKPRSWVKTSSGLVLWVPLGSPDCGAWVSWEA